MVGVRLVRRRSGASTSSSHSAARSASVAKNASAVRSLAGRSIGQRIAWTIISRTGAAAKGRLMGETRRDPRRLLGRQEVARVLGLDLGDALEGVEQLVELVGVPGRHEVHGVFGPRAGAHRRTCPHRDRYGLNLGR